MWAIWIIYASTKLVNRKTQCVRAVSSERKVLLCFIEFRDLLCNVVQTFISSQREFYIEHIVQQLVEHAGKVALFMLL